MQQVSKIGFIGFGRAAELIYLPLMTNFPNVKVSAITEIRKDRREFAAIKFKGCKIYDTICDEFINDIDAAIILTPPNYRIQPLTEILKNQKNVLVEKPLSLSLDGIKDLLNFNNNTSSKLAVAFNHRYWNPINELKEIIANKNEEVVSAEIVFVSNYSNWNPISSESNPLEDLAPHIFDLVRYIFDDEIVSIESTENSKDDFSFDVKTSKKLSVKCRAAYTVKSLRTIKIKTSKNEYLVRSGSEKIKPPTEIIRSILDFKDKLQRGLMRKKSSLKNSYKFQLEDFFNLNKGVKHRLAGLSDGIENIKAILAANKSLSEKGRKVFLNEFE